MCAAGEDLTGWPGQLLNYKGKLNSAFLGSLGSPRNRLRGACDCGQILWEVTPGTVGSGRGCEKGEVYNGEVRGVAWGSDPWGSSERIPIHSAVPPPSVLGWCCLAGAGLTPARLVPQLAEECHQVGSQVRAC